MSKYKSRVKRLVNKTHNFISYSDHSLVGDYFRERFEEAEKSPDIERELEEFQKLNAQYHRTNDPELFARLVNYPAAVRLKFLHEESLRMCDKYPHGCWQPKAVTNDFLKLVREAKNYFKRKNDSNGED